MDSSLTVFLSPRVLSIWSKREVKRTKSTLDFPVKLSNVWWEANMQIQKTNTVELGLLEYPCSTNSGSLILAHNPLYLIPIFSTGNAIYYWGPHTSLGGKCILWCFKNRINANCVHNPTLKTWLTCTWATLAVFPINTVTTNQGNCQLSQH